MALSPFEKLKEKYSELIQKQQYYHALNLLNEYERDHFLYENEYKEFNQLKGDVVKLIDDDNYQRKINQLSDDELLIMIFEHNHLHHNLFELYWKKAKKPEIDYFIRKLQNDNLPNEDKLFLIFYLKDHHYLDGQHELDVYNAYLKKQQKVNLDLLQPVGEPNSKFQKIKDSIMETFFKEPSNGGFGVSILYNEFINTLGDLPYDVDINQKVNEIVEKVKQLFSNKS